EDLPRGAVERGATDGDGARAEGAGAVRHHGRIALDDLDAIEGDAEAVGQNLCEGGGVALPVVVRAEQGAHATGGMDANVGRLEESGARAEGAGQARRRHAR